LIQIALVLLQADHEIPSACLGQFEHRRLCVKRIEQEDVKEAADVKILELSKQAQCGRVLAFSGLQPFDGQEGLGGAADNLASHGTVVIL